MGGGGARCLYVVLAGYMACGYKKELIVTKLKRLNENFFLQYHANDLSLTNSKSMQCTEKLETTY
jgi:hypothetical protein